MEEVSNLIVFIPLPPFFYKESIAENTKRCLSLLVDRRPAE